MNKTFLAKISIVNQCMMGSKFLPLTHRSSLKTKITNTHLQPGAILKKKKKKCIQIIDVSLPWRGVSIHDNIHFNSRHLSIKEHAFTMRELSNYTFWILMECKRNKIPKFKSRSSNRILSILPNVRYYMPTKLKPKKN